MNIRGVSFRVPQGRNDLLQEILDGIDVQALCWYNVESQNETWSIPEENAAFFRKERYDGAEFSRVIHQPHFVLFLKLEAYPPVENCPDMHTYEEFLKSSCLLLMLIYDCEYVEIFSKDAVITKTLFDNAGRKGFSEIVLITDENDGRTRMDIM